eukprot:scaffold60783_cov63-Phaeocystis_antarctica.AAC.1
MVLRRVAAAMTASRLAMSTSPASLCRATRDIRLLELARLALLAMAPLGPSDGREEARARLAPPPTTTRLAPPREANELRGRDGGRGASKVKALWLGRCLVTELGRHALLKSFSLAVPGEGGGGSGCSANLGKAEMPSSAASPSAATPSAAAAVLGNAKVTLRLERTEDGASTEPGSWKATPLVLLAGVLLSSAAADSRGDFRLPAEGGW